MGNNLSLSPADLVLTHFKLPFDLKKYQVDTTNALAPLERSGHYLSMGTGKTVVSTVCALFKKLRYNTQTIVIMPPLLIKQWGKWLRTITPALSVTEFKGTPAERAKLSLDSDFVLVGIQIFKKEYDRFVSHFQDRQVVVIVDEATMLSNISSDQHQKVYDFCVGREMMALTGTPMNNPMDAYGLLKFVAPGLYRNKAQFERVHIAEKDFFGNPSQWQNLELLAENMSVNSMRILLEDVYDEMPPVTYTPLDYDLAPKHLKLYQKLANEELLKLPDGGKIDATSANRLTHALGQIVVNWGHFAGDDDLVSNTVELIEEKLSELGNGKLVVFANYKMTIAMLTEKLKKYGAVAVNSEITATQKQKNIDKFVGDPKCRVFVAQFRSAGYGLDGLQIVANTAIYAEPCTSPRDFSQSVARLARTGQTKPVQIYMAIASGTLQVRAFNNLLQKDELVNSVIRNRNDLRDLIFGG